MISLAQENNFYHAVVFNDFTLQDFREFEQCVVRTAKCEGPVNLLVDLRDMLGCTLDMALEEIRFSREHRQEIARIAVISTDQWVAWSAWLSRVMTEADIQVFENMDEAVAWISQPTSEPAGTG